MVTNTGWTARRSLGRQLRALRLAAGKTAEDLRPIGSRDKISRIERGQGPYKFPDVQSWALMCGADPATVTRLTDLADKTRAGLVYEDYSDVLPTWAYTFYELESAASHIRTWEPNVLPGLLQTKDYAREVFQRGVLTLSAETVDKRITARLERQHNAFERRPDIHFAAVLGQGALVLQVGGAAVMHDQLAHLHELNGKPQVSLHVLTWPTGAHAGLEGGFTLLNFTHTDDPPIVFVESHMGARYLEKPQHVAEYQEIFTSIAAESVPLEDWKP